MAQKRMFSKKITDTDKFLDMPLSTQALYFHLNMDGDDDGFVGNPKTIKKKIGANDNDLDLLVFKQFIIPFENGVIVIKDWRIHNTLRNDRYTPTIYQEEKKAIDSGLLSNVSGWLPDGCQVVASLEPQHNLTKHNITEQRKDIMSDKSDDVKTVIDYLNQKNGTSYRASSKKNKSLINARFSEGYSVDDFKKVIDIKSNDWIGTDMAKFFRPETLFGNKFDGYLNQVPIKKQAPVGSRVPEWAKEEYDDNKVVPDW